MDSNDGSFDLTVDVPEWTHEDAATFELCQRDFEFRIQCQLAESVAERRSCRSQALPRLEKMMLADWRSLPGVVLGPGEHNWQLEEVGSSGDRLTRKFVCGFCGGSEFEVRTVDGGNWTETSAPTECPGAKF